MTNSKYLKEYKEGQDSYNDGFLGIALEQFSNFINQEKHPKNSLELRNAYRYIAKLHYEEGEYIESLKTWCHKSTRSCFIWKDFYSRALAAIFEFKDVLDKNYVLIPKKNDNYEYNVMDVLIDLEVAQSLVLERIKEFSGKRSRTKLRWFFEIYYNSFYYKAIVINNLFQLKNANNTPVNISNKEKKYKIYNKEVSAKIHSEIENLSPILESNEDAFEYGMCELVRIQEIKSFVCDLIYGYHVTHDFYKTTYYNDWDFIPDPLFSLVKYKLKTNLYKCSNLLNDEEREHQEDLWKFELVNFDFDKTLNLTYNLNIIMIEFIESGWDIDESATSFFDRFNNIIDNYAELVKFFKSQIMPEEDWKSESFEEERIKYLECLQESHNNQKDQYYDNQTDDYDPYGDTDLGNPNGWW